MPTRADLQGSLAVFAPELLFQLMSLAHASGVLTIHARKHEARIVFQDGQLRFASGDVGRQARLGEVLVSVGRLQPTQRASAVRAWQRAGGKKRLGAILLDRGLIDRAELEAFIQEQIKNLIVEVLRWRSGEFVFEKSAGGNNEDIVLDVQLDRLLLECMTRLDHEGEMQRKGS
jgi:hypothetical protein